MFNKKLNATEVAIEVTEEITIVDGAFEGSLAHDNVVRESIVVLDADGLPVRDVTVTDNIEKAWETVIRVRTGSPYIHVSYETFGDVVDADDINYVYDVVGKYQSKIDAINIKSGKAIEDTENLKVEHNKDIANIKKTTAEKEHKHIVSDITGLDDKLDNIAENAGKVKSVNKKTGNVVLSGADIKCSSNSLTSIEDAINEQKQAVSLLAMEISRTSTVVIANYDSTEPSRIGADVVIKEGEDASVIINQVIQLLEGKGGEVKLMEGKYQLDSKISILVDDITLSGVGKATKLIARDLPSGSASGLVEVGENESEIKGFTIYDLVIDGNNLERGYNGIALKRAVDSTISNVECSNNRWVGIRLRENSSATISNVECSNNRWDGIKLEGDSSATISNVECSNNKSNGISLTGDSSATISNVECSNNIEAGVGIQSSSAEVYISSATLKNNRINPEYVNQAQLEVGYHADRNTKDIFVSNCKIIDTTGKTRGVAIIGDNHVFINNQFVGEFKEKINDKGNDSTVRDNVGV